MATERNNPLINRVFDHRYLILRKLGSGGMAEVYLAEDQELGRKVALKMLNERHASDEQFVERFKREARNAAGLSHPHIVRIYDRGQAEGTYYIAMEYLDGPTLKELLVRKGPTPPLTAIKFAREILSALAEAHRHEIVHRDIKPHNVIVSPDWEIKVTDFGIARSGASPMTEVGSIVGTAQYLSPEQARGAPVDQRSDLYSLGIVLYEMLTGTVPFTGDAAVEIAMKHLSVIPEPPSKLRPEVSPDLDAIVMRALAKDADQRYSSAEEMDADLARVARGASVSARTEEAMTQVIGQTRISSAATVAQPPVVAIAPAAPPAYRPVGSTPDLPRRRSVWPKLLWLLALVIAGAGGYLIYERVESTLKGSSTVAVQNVLDVAKPNAVLLLHQQGFNVRLEYAASTTVAAKLVISQAPTPGTKAKKDSTVTLLISTGIPEVPVPSIKGDSRSQAASLLAAPGLTPNFVEIHSTTIAPGEVMAANPAPGSVVPKGSTVRVNISAGPAETAVPNVVSDPYANAASALQGAGFAPAQVGANSSAPLGQVIGQTPVAGTLEPPGTKIQLTVSKGPKTVTVENVVGDNQADAAQILVQEGFKVSVTTQDVTDPTQAGLVLSQSPAGGALADGASVTITVGSYVGPTTPTTTASTPVTTTNTDTTTNTTTTTSTTVTTPATTTQTTPATTTTGAATTPATPPSTTPATTNPATTTSTTIGAAPPTTTSSSTTPATTLP